MKLQNKNDVDQLSDELNELKLKIAKMNARRNAQMNLLQTDLDGRYWRETSHKSYRLYPNLYYNDPSCYNYPSMYPRYRSLENLQVLDPNYQRPSYRKAITFTADQNDNSNLKSNVTSASLSNLLSKLKDFVFEQEKQLTNDLLNSIAQSRRPQSLMPHTTASHSRLKDRTESGQFLNPINKKDNFYKRYNTFAKRILKPLPTPSTGKNVYSPSTLNSRFWFDNYDDEYYEPRWTRWYRRYLTSPRYRHYLSDYNYYVPKLFTLPPDIESIVGSKTKSTDRAHNYSKSNTPDLKFYSNNKYDPSESDSYIKSRLPNWKQYYYTHKLKTKPSKESYLQYYDPHLDFFPDTASVDSTNELLDTSSAIENKLPDNPEQLINEYRDAIYEDVIQDLRFKQQGTSNTFPRRKLRRAERSLSPTFSSKCNNADDWDVKLQSTKYNSDAPYSSPKRNLLGIKNTGKGIPPSAHNSRKYNLSESVHDHQKNRFTTEFSESAQPPIEYMKPSGIQYLEHGPQEEESISTNITGEFLGNLKLDTVDGICNKIYEPLNEKPLVEGRENKQQLNLENKEDVGFSRTPNTVQSPTRKVLAFSENVRKKNLATGNEVYQPVYKPLVADYKQQYENTKTFPSSIRQNFEGNTKPKNEELIPIGTLTSRSSRSMTYNGAIVDSNISYHHQPSSQKSTVRYIDEPFDEHTKPLDLITKISSQNDFQNKNAYPITEEITSKFNKTCHSTQLSQSKNDIIIESDPNSTITHKNDIIIRNNNQSALNPGDIMRKPRTIPQQADVDHQALGTENTPLMDDSHPMTFNTKSSNPDQNSPELFDSNESHIKSVPLLQRHSSQLIGPLLSQQENISSSSTELFNTANSQSGLQRKYSSQLIRPQAIEEYQISAVPTESLVNPSINSRSVPFRRRSSQLIEPVPPEQENVSIITSTTPLKFINARSASLQRRSSQHSQMIANPASGHEHIPTTLVDSSLQKSASKLNKESLNANLRARASSFRRPSTKLTSAPVLEQDSEIERRVSSGDQRFARDINQITKYSANIQDDKMRDSDNSYQNVVFSQPIYQQPSGEAVLSQENQNQIRSFEGVTPDDTIPDEDDWRKAGEEKNLDDYYYENNYPQNLYEAVVDQRFNDDNDLCQPIDTVQYDEKHRVYDPYEQSYYIQNDYYDPSNNSNYPTAAYDLNRGSDTYYQQDQNYENCESPNYTIEAEPQTYEAPYDSNAAGSSDYTSTHYIQDTFPEECTAIEDGALPTTVEPTNEPTEDCEIGESTSTVKRQPSESKGMKKLISEEEEGTTSVGSKVNNVRDRKKSVENSEIRNREPISRRASKISLQSSTDDRKSRVQSTVGESQKRTPKLRQVDNKLKRTASTVSRTKMPPTTKRTSNL